MAGIASMSWTHACLATMFGGMKSTVLTIAIAPWLLASTAAAQVLPTANTPSGLGASVAPVAHERPAPATVAASFGAGARLSNFGAGGVVDVRLRVAREVQLGVDLALGRDWDVFVGGHAGHDALRFDGGASVLATMWRRDNVSMSFGARAHVRRFDGATQRSALAQRGSWAAGADLSVLMHAELSDRVVFRTGVVLPVVFELAPEVQPDMVGGLLSLGAAVALAERVSLTLDMESGGVFGASGDGVKFLARGTMALRFQLGADRWLRF